MNGPALCRRIIAAIQYLGPNKIRNLGWIIRSREGQREWYIEACMRTHCDNMRSVFCRRHLNFSHIAPLRKYVRYITLDNRGVLMSMTPGASLDAAIAGITRGVDNARKVASQISKDNSKSSASNSKSSSTSKTANSTSTLGNSVDVKA